MAKFLRPISKATSGLDLQQFGGVDSQTNIPPVIPKGMGGSPVTRNPNIILDPLRQDKPFSLTAATPSSVDTQSAPAFEAQQAVIPSAPQNIGAKGTIAPAQQVPGLVTSPAAVPKPIQNIGAKAIKPEPTPGPGALWTGSPAGMGEAYNAQLMSQITGKSYDPFAAGSREAEARAEASQRAGTAGQIAKAGFAGTGIGQQIAGGTEDQLLRNRFANEIAIEQAKQGQQAAALGIAQNYATATQGQLQTNFENAVQIGDAASAAAAYKAATGKDIDPVQLQAAIDSRAAAEKRLSEATVGETRKTAVADLGSVIGRNPTWATNPAAALSDPAFMSAAQAAWEKQGGTGAVSPEWATNQIKEFNVASNAGAMANLGIQQLVQSGAITADQGKIMSSLPYSIYSPANWTVDPKTGAVTPNLTEMEKSQGLPAGTLTGEAPVEKLKTPQGTEVKNPEGLPEGRVFSVDGSMYKVSAEGPKPVTDTETLRFNDLLGQTPTDSGYSAVLKNTVPMSNEAMWANFDGMVDSKKLLKVTNEADGKEYLVRAISTGSHSTGKHRHNDMLFESTDGKPVSVSFRSN